MYLDYFGLTDQPFSIAPNPDYLFLSERHKEALAHLTYGLGDAGGFVLLTGEVGTGKTTVTRCMLENVGDDTQVAFVLNPSLSELELLASICDELRIRYKKSEATLKNLTDKIKNRLLKNHSQNKRTMLVIDEAQHLSGAVLEQLRLLTNLETNQRKLLQIILVGQPELQTLLKRNDLRQLAQRITARYHLMPLNEAEVFAYIKHRLHVAGCDKMLFENAAIKRIHQLTGGIPRLINLLCERALMGAFANSRHLVNKAMIATAATEILPLEANAAASHNANYVVWMYACFAIVALLVGIGLSFIF
ncbi:ExeA family protein [Pseudoalteromonas sp.]|uniref:ExeA family protein n=1 Tax=Pseudoalteromonas sp. TaxID=53249 RepID=UPI0035666304